MIFWKLLKGIHIIVTEYICAHLKCEHSIFLKITQLLSFKSIELLAMFDPVIKNDIIILVFYCLKICLNQCFLFSLNMFYNLKMPDDFNCVLICWYGVCV